MKIIFHVFAASILVLCSWLGSVQAGPSYSVECNDEARGTNLHLFDANPRTGLISVTGNHNQLPEGFQAFSVNINGDAVPLQVIKYTAYEVELQLVVDSGGTGIPVEAGPDAGSEIGVLERIVLENHSAVQVSEQERAAAAILVFGSGLHLRFNVCRIRGDIDVMDWSQTFQSR